MPGINLEALNTGDLRRLLRVAHDRHDGPLADRLEWEIAARATGAARGAHPFATLSDEEPDEPGFRMTATDDAPIAPGAAARRDPEIRTFAREAPEPDAWGPEARQEPEAPEAPEPIAEPRAARMPEVQAPERSRWLSIGLAALAGCLLTAAVFLAGALTGERTALKRSAQAALAPGAASPTGWPDPTRTAPSLAPLDQAFSGPASPPGAEERPLAVTQAAPKKAKKRGARTWEANRPTRLDTWSKGSEQEEPIY